MDMKKDSKHIFSNTVINVLGTEYSVIFKSFEDEPEFKRGSASGLCDMMNKEISICKIDTCPDMTNLTDKYVENHTKEVLRHEIVHAFLHESGLDADSNSSLENGWAVNEEIVDWIAIQSPKIFKAFNDANAL